MVWKRKFSITHYKNDHISPTYHESISLIRHLNPNPMVLFQKEILNMVVRISWFLSHKIFTISWLLSFYCNCNSPVSCCYIQCQLTTKLLKKYFYITKHTNISYYLFQCNISVNLRVVTAIINLDINLEDKSSNNNNINIFISNKEKAKIRYPILINCGINLQYFTCID